MKRRSPKNGSEDRKAINITLPPAIRQKGDRLADEDKRSLSQELEWLIDQEFKRREALLQPA